MSNERTTVVTVFDPITGESSIKNTEFLAEEEELIVSEDESEEDDEDPVDLPEETPIAKKIQNIDVDGYSDEAFRERDEALRQAQAYKQESIEAKKDKFLTQKDALDLYVKENEATLEDLKTSLIEASGVQDHTKVMELQLKIQDIKANLSKAQDASVNISKQIKELDTEFEKVKAEPLQPKQPSIPLAARMWAKGKEVFLNAEAYAALPKEKRAHLYKVRESVGSIVQSMISEGMSPETAVFYEDLDLRLSDKFPAYQQFLEGGVDAIGKASAPAKKASSAAKGPSHSGPAVTGKSKKVFTFSMLPPEAQRSYERNFMSTMSKADYLKLYAETNREHVKELLNK